MSHDVLAAYCAPPIQNGIIHIPTYESILQVLAWDQGHDRRLLGVLDSVHAYIPEARTQVVDAFLPTEATWLWSIDYDMIFNPDALDKLLAVTAAEPNPLILSALYFNRLDDGNIWPTWLDRDNEADVESVPIQTVKMGELRECAAVGMGCTLIHRSVLEKMRAHRPDDPWPWFSHMPIRGYGGRYTMAGEDVTFCIRARALGFRIYGYSGVVCDHLKSTRIGVRSFTEQREPVPSVKGGPPEEVLQRAP